MKRGDKLKVIDAEAHQTRGGHPGRKPRFKLGEIVTVKRLGGLQSGPDAQLELHGHPGFWKAARFEPVEG